MPVYIRIHHLVLLKALLFTALFFPLCSQAQQGDTISSNSIKGKVKDSVYHFMLTSATVAVYKDSDSSLLQFSLPNNFGEFIITPLPLHIKLRLVITHVGYIPFLRKFTLTEEKKAIDFGLLYMYQDTGKGGNTLKTVVVKSTPPVRMNGDTLEFNADAFRLDSSATAEDLMRRLPGFTIWGDGDITFNGKKINQVLVDGKPFMGTTDITIVTRNLPKDALDKIQVYQQRNEKNPLDSTLYANLKLKEDKKTGYFGKLGGGYGTDNRYAADGAISGFTKKLQLSAVGAVNNVNKIANNTEELMGNTTFKGEGANTDYQSDFTMRGLNRPLAAGAKLQYDFIPDSKYRKTSRLLGDYFISRNPVFINDNTITNTFLGADTILALHSVSENHHLSGSQQFNTSYERSTEKINLSANASLSMVDDRNQSRSLSEQDKTGIGTISRSNNEDDNQSRTRNLTAGVSFTNLNPVRSDTKARIPKEFTIGYQFSANDKRGNGHTLTRFESVTNPADNRTFDRLYEQQDGSGNSHKLSASYPGLTQLIFNRHSFGGIRMGLAATYIFSSNNSNTKVRDFDTALGKYAPNNYLTNRTHAYTSDFMPSFTLSKNFYKGLTNRYSKGVSVDVDVKGQWYGMQHEATQAMQNFSYRYARFVPSVNIRYDNHQYGSYEATYKLSFSTKVNYPEVNQIAPLVDSSNLWYIPRGNRHLQPEYEKTLVFGYELTGRKPRNPYGVWLNARAGQTDDAIADSSLYSKDGVRTEYLVNMSGRRYISGDAGFRKSLELPNNTIQFSAGYSIGRTRYPQYINSTLNVANTLNQNANMAVSYAHLDLITLRAEQDYGFNRSEQNRFNSSTFASRNQYTRISGTLQFPKKLVWSTNLTYNLSSNNSTEPVRYTIWNASLTYRFLPGNRGEAKFSALDLLHQNKGIINTATGNTQTFTTSNVLQQYFMLTFSYYPRRFGK